ncbi:1-acyl-sn-glycerol-3-phosphate acyltransferase [Pedobacter sp. AW1-32]|uniref:1-acyl-sn-glycerol-3-phosphate acyltransferase n=1 Tax=Pedobacter sp. AW1-32 TaxID=3383026 RepID=UPI003FF00B8D
MIKDKPNKYIRVFMIGVEKFLLSRFSKVRYTGEINVDPNRSVLLIMNHVGFNDGAVVYRFCRKYIRKDFKSMSVEAQLKAFKLLKYIGCFSVNKKSRTLVDSLNYAAELLSDPKNLLTIFPQGELFSMHLNKIHFETGLSHILKKTKKPIQIIFAVSLIDFLDNFKPTVDVSYQEYFGERNLAEMESAYNTYYKTCKIKQQHLHHPPQSVIDTE